ncbi:MAG: MBL fold metallo-hydrolase [Acidobacteriota bacterium]|nr:MBL fold metallo-hydrolase [Acidobacteriota bacterium]
MRKLLLALVFLLPGIVLAQQPQDFSKVQVKITKVAGNVYLLQGAGGNIAASVGDDGILLVDTEYAPLGDKILAALDSVAPGKKVRYVVNTHYHGDHTNGNAFFGSRGAVIIAQANLRKRLAEGSAGGTGGTVKMESPPQPAAALPVITYENEMSIHFNGEDVRIVHFPAAHTDGDSVVYFTKSNVAHMGDIFVRYGLPFSDIRAGGSIQGMIAACEKVSEMLPADAKVIPGHGDLASVDDVRAYTKMLNDTMAVARKALAAHKTLEQMKQENILAPWADKAKGFVKADTFIEELYYSLTGPNAQAGKAD